jgi:hypothetical protein
MPGSAQPGSAKPGSAQPGAALALPGQIAPDDPRAGDVQELLGRHLAFAYSQSGPEHVHALAVDGCSTR